MVFVRPHALRASLALLFLISPAGCALDLSGNLETDSSIAPDGDVRPDDSTDASTDAVPEHHGDSDGTPPPDGTSPDGEDGHAEAPDSIGPDTEPTDPAGPDADEPEREPFCGDGNVAPGEECDDASSMCVDCMLIPPAGWRRCTDSAGNVVFFLLEDWAGIHSQYDMAEHCRQIIEALAPEGFRDYGLAVLSDEAVWHCIEAALDSARQYYIGLAQRADGAEPAGGWVWGAWNGAAWVEVGSCDFGTWFIPSSIDGTCGTGEVDCGRIMNDGSGWTFWDYGCDSEEDWDGICMIRF
jgi:hypothetical protein